MAYLKDYTRSKLLKNPFINDLMHEVLLLKPGSYVERLFGEKHDGKRIQNNVLVLLNGIKVKGDFATRLRHDGKMFWVLRVSNVRSVRTSTKAYYRG
jgi:hypothetical protein